MSCPINLECLAEKCPNQDYCNHLAAPWPLPYQIWEIDYWHSKGALVVSIPDFTNWEEVPNTDYHIQIADEYDNWIRHIRRELKEMGWANAIELPYYWDEIERTLIVTNICILNPEEPKPFYDQDGFAPAVKLDNWRARWEPCRTQLQIAWQEERKLPERDKWGFYQANGVPGLAWKWQEDEEISSAD